MAQSSVAPGRQAPITIPIAQTPAGAGFATKVRARAKNHAITGEIGDALRVSLAAPPVEGRANAACIEFFADLLKVPRSSVTIASGERTPRKLMRVTGLSAEEVRKRLG